MEKADRREPRRRGPVQCMRLATVCIATALASSAAHAQDPVKTFPHNYSIALENSAVTVVRVHYGPHEKVGVHDHSKSPTIYVYLSDSGPVRFQHFEANSFALTRPPTVKGAYRVSPGRVERHTVENLGNTSSDYLRVELKQVALGGVQPFRGEAPASLTQSEDAVEVNTPALRIERIVCAGTSPCAVKASAAPSLLVAFTPLQESASGAGGQEGALAAGAVRWLPATQALTMRGENDASADLLRILLPGARQ